MSTLEKTISMLSALPETQIENIYSYVRYIYAQQSRYESPDSCYFNEILEKLTGILPDSGKTLEQYREERIEELYGIID